jgi:hypothetical protein
VSLGSPRGQGLVGDSAANRQAESAGERLSRITPMSAVNLGLPNALFNLESHV